MADYTFDGKTLRKATGQKMGEADRTSVRSWNSARLGEVQGKNIRDAYGKKVLEFDGKTVKDDVGQKVTTIKDIQNVIEGEPSIYMVAAWYFLVKGQQTNMT